MENGLYTGINSQRGFILAFPFRRRAFKEMLLDEIDKACPFNAKKNFYKKTFKTILLVLPVSDLG